MISAVSAAVPRVPTPIVVSTMSIVATAAIPVGGIVGTFACHRKDRTPKDKGNHANERQQQNSEMYPTGLGHPISPLFPRPGRQSDSTMWM